MPVQRLPIKKYKKICIIITHQFNRREEIMGLLKTWKFQWDYKSKSINNILNVFSSKAAQKFF